MKYYRAYERKEDGTYIETYRTENETEIYRDLANELLYLKVFKSPMYKSLRQQNNYDGTRTIIIYQDYGRSVYRVPA